MLPFRDKLDYTVFRTFGRMTPHQQNGDILFNFLIFSVVVVCLSPLYWHWAEIVPSAIDCVD